MRTIVRGIVLGVGLLTCTSSAEAQEIATSLSELQLLVRPGETVTVTDAEGRSVKGQVEVLSPSLLVLSDRSGRHEWADSDIASIRQVKSDSLGNGALIGLAVGGGIGLVGVIVAAVYAGIGAGVGVGIDALIRKEYVVYQPSAPRTQVRLVPLLTPTRQGLAVSVSF